jgi:hypothetical protein
LARSPSGPVAPSPDSDARHPASAGASLAAPFGSAFPGSPRDSENLAPNDPELQAYRLAQSGRNPRAYREFARTARADEADATPGRDQVLSPKNRFPDEFAGLQRAIRLINLSIGFQASAPRAPMFDFDGDRLKRRCR